LVELDKAFNDPTTVSSSSNAFRRTRRIQQSNLLRARDQPLRRRQGFPRQSSEHLGGGGDNRWVIMPRSACQVL
jgi:hypothetical protein